MDDPDSDSKRYLQLAIGSHYSLRAKELWLESCQSGDVDWQAVSNLAFPVGLAPLFLSSIKMIDAEGVPPNLLTALKNSYFETASINALALHHLKLILHQFAQNDLPILLLKGAALLLTVYDNLALRPMVDVDFLIAFASLPNALEILESMGYLAQYPFPFEDSSGLFWNEVCLDSDQDGALALELHWQLIDNPYYAQRLPVEMLFQRAQIVTRDSLTALILSPEDLILHLCTHNVFHHLGQFQRAAVDVAFVIQKYQAELDWVALISTAKKDDLNLPLSMTLLGAAEDWFAPIPDDVLTKLRMLKPSKKETFFLNSQRSEFLKLVRTFITLPGSRMKTRYITGQLFPSPNYLAWRYGISTSNPRPVAFSKRYISGLSRLIAEIKGHDEIKKQTKKPGQS